jgi:hypothetical protein
MNPMGISPDSHGVLPAYSPGSASGLLTTYLPSSHLLMVLAITPAMTEIRKAMKLILAPPP